MCIASEYILVSCLTAPYCWMKRWELRQKKTNKKNKHVKKIYPQPKKSPYPKHDNNYANNMTSAQDKKQHPGRDYILMTAWVWVSTGDAHGARGSSIITESFARKWISPWLHSIGSPTEVLKCDFNSQVRLLDLKGLLERRGPATWELNAFGFCRSRRIVLYLTGSYKRLCNHDSHCVFYRSIYSLQPQI